MKKFKGLIFAIAAECIAAAAMAGCSTVATDIKTLCGDNVTEILFELDVTQSYIATLKDEDDINAVIEKFDSVELEKGENDDFNLVESLIIYIYGESKTTIYVAPDGAVSATADDVTYYSDGGSADYSGLYSMFRSMITEGA